MPKRGMNETCVRHASCNILFKEQARVRRRRLEFLSFLGRSVNLYGVCWISRASLEIRIAVEAADFLIFSVVDVHLPGS